MVAGRRRVTPQGHPFLRPLPDGLGDLVDLTLDLRWTWNHATDRLWEMLAPEMWERTGNPWLILQGVSQRHLERLAADSGFRAELARLMRARSEYLTERTWFDEAHAGRDMQVAYFSMEYGLAEALPLYAGGLGILAGDQLKTASDLGVPLVAVGLLYQEGYFRQMLDASGVQLELYPHNVATSLPITPLRGTDGAWLSVPLELPGRELVLRVWRAQVGRIPLYLLDSNDPMNSPADRGITGKLYGGGEEMRLIQEMVLGVGGWRALELLGVSPDVCHLNEGHAAMVTIERARSHMQRHRVGFQEALLATRAGNVFTTHTPVAAAFDTYPIALLAEYGAAYTAGLGVRPGELLALGRRHAHDHGEPFNMAYLAARTCGRINAVSRLHGEVSRQIFSDLYPRWPLPEVPVGHITNGVHVPSWDSPWADRLWTETCGKDRWRVAVDAHAEVIADLSDEALWQVCSEERADLVRYARGRLVRQLGQRGAGAEVLAQAQYALDPNALTLGFARRFTGYKRPNLLLHDRERLLRLLTDPARPVQLIVAGKAHPQDGQGKEFIHAWVDFIRSPDVRAHVVFLEDYDIALAQQLVQGVDVWINTPRRPWEACGTSGMKVLVNGGLNLSELDGWWAEAYSAEVGWALGDGHQHDERGWDATEAAQLYTLLEEEIIPAFYDRDASGVPRGWVARMRASMATLAPQFSSNRMVRDYVEQVYLPAAQAYRDRVANGGAHAGALRAWESELRQHWDHMHLGRPAVTLAGDAWQFDIQVYLGDVDPEAIAVEIYADPGVAGDPVTVPMQRTTPLIGATRGYLYRALVSARRPARDYTVRVVPVHPQARVPIELPLILWSDGGAAP